MRRGDVFNSPTQRKMASSARGRSKRVSAMTEKVITREFVVPTLLAIVLGIVLSIGAVYLTDAYLGPMDQAEAHYSVTYGRGFTVPGGSLGPAELPAVGTWTSV